MKKIIYLVGLPCSGKTTWATKNYPNAVFVSNDLIVEEAAKEKGLTYNEVYSQMNYKDVKKKCRQVFEDAVENGAEVIVIDNTHMTVKSRKTYTADGYERECVVFMAPDELLQKRNIRPGKHIPKEVFERMKENWVQPTLEEGFTKIRSIKCL